MSAPGGTGTHQRLRVLAVDDEAPVLDELAHMLAADPGVSEVRTATTAAEALAVLGEGGIDVVLLDIHLPGLMDGMDLARALARRGRPPIVVFVTAFEEHAIEAFEVQAYDYLLKPVRAERLAEALRRARAELSPVAPTDLATVPVTLGGRTKLLERDRIWYAETSGDYVRLHGDDGSFLLRLPISSLESAWASAGFIRIHRCFLVALRFVEEIRADDQGAYIVVVRGRELPVSRRRVRDLKEHLVRMVRRIDSRRDASGEGTP